MTKPSNDYEKLCDAIMNETLPKEAAPKMERWTVTQIDIRDDGIRAVSPWSVMYPTREKAYAALKAATKRIQREYVREYGMVMQEAEDQGVFDGKVVPGQPQEAWVRGTMGEIAVSATLMLRDDASCFIIRKVNG
jgi:hypothetical protein